MDHPSREDNPLGEDESFLLRMIARRRTAACGNAERDRERDSVRSPREGGSAVYASNPSCRLREISIAGRWEVAQRGYADMASRCSTCVPNVGPRKRSIRTLRDYRDLDTGRIESGSPARQRKRTSDFLGGLLRENETAAMLIRSFGFY